MLPLLLLLLLHTSVASPDGASQCDAPRTADDLFGMTDRGFVADSTALQLTVPTSVVAPDAVVSVAIASPNELILGVLLNARVDGAFAGTWIHGDLTQDGSGGAGCGADEASAVATHTDVIRSNSLTLQYRVPMSAGTVTIDAAVLVGVEQQAATQTFHAMRRTFTVGNSVAAACTENQACTTSNGAAGMCQKRNDVLECVSTACVAGQACSTVDNKIGLCVTNAGVNECKEQMFTTRAGATMTTMPDNQMCTVGQPCKNSAGQDATCLAAHVCATPCEVGGPCTAPSGADGQCTVYGPLKICIEECTPGKACVDFRGGEGFCQGLFGFTHCTPDCTPMEDCTLDDGGTGTCTALPAFGNTCIPKCPVGTTCTSDTGQEGVCTAISPGLNACLPPACEVGKACTFSGVPGTCVLSNGEATCSFATPVGCPTTIPNFPCKTSAGVNGNCDESKVCVVATTTTTMVGATAIATQAPVTTCKVGDSCTLANGQPTGICQLDGTPSRPTCLPAAVMEIPGCPTPTFGAACTTEDGQAGQCNQYRMCIVRTETTTTCVVGAECEVDGYKGMCAKSSLDADPTCQASEVAVISHRCPTAQEECFDGALKGEVGICLVTKEGRRCVPNVAAGPPVEPSGAAPLSLTASALIACTTLASLL